MSQKRAKRERKVLRTIDFLFSEIMEDVLEELEWDIELFYDWASLAIPARLLALELPIENFLPSQLENILEDIDQRALQHINSIS